MAYYQLPVVSVILPLFNAELFLVQAIDSILNQTIVNFELIVVNDGSTDKSLDLVYSYNDKRLIVINNEENKGLIYSLNKGIEVAKGKYIARMDADDIALPQRLQKQVDFLEENPSIALVGGYAEFIDDKGTVFQHCKVPITHEDIVQKIFISNCFIHPCVMFRASVIKELGGYRTEAIHAEDYDLWLRIIQKHNVANIPEILIQYRIHANQISQCKLKLQRASADKARFAAFKNYSRLYKNQNFTAIKPLTVFQRLRGVSPSVGSDYLGWIRLYKSMGSFSKANRLTLTAIFLAPFFIDLYLLLLPSAVVKVAYNISLTVKWYIHKINTFLKK